MKVGVLIRYMDKTGGSEIATQAMLRALVGAGHDVTLYTNAPPSTVPRGVSVAVPDNPAPPIPPKPPLLRRFDFYRGGYEGLMGMSDDDVLVISDWEVFMETTRARRVLYYFHLAPDREKATQSVRLSHVRPKKWPRYAYQKHLVRKRISRFDFGKVTLVPNSLHTGRIIEEVFGHPTGAVLYPPVGVKEFREHAGRPKQRRAITVANYWRSKRHDVAMRVARKAGVEWVSAGTTVEPDCQRYADSLREMAGAGADIRTNLGRAELVEAVSSSKVYLHAAYEPFGIAIVEAMAAGCVPIVPNRAATVETVPFGELRFDTEEEAAAKVRAAADGQYDEYLPRLAGHADKFSEEVFAKRLLRLVERSGGAGQEGGAA